MTVPQLQPGYKEVFTVTDYYDGPRKGIANFKGLPHFYECCAIMTSLTCRVTVLAKTTSEH